MGASELLLKTSNSAERSQNPFRTVQSVKNKNMHFNLKFLSLSMFPLHILFLFTKRHHAPPLRGLHRSTPGKKTSRKEQDSDGKRKLEEVEVATPPSLTYVG